VIVELLIAIPLLLIGLYRGWRSLAEPVVLEGGRSRFLVALHEAAAAAFWLSLGGFFLGYGLVDDPVSWRWLALVPIGMAALRLATAAILARG
jgi:hypothetical protein